jgi:hypothetical protein
MVGDRAGIRTCVGIGFSHKSRYAVCWALPAGDSSKKSQGANGEVESRFMAEEFSEPDAACAAGLLVQA